MFRYFKHFRVKYRTIFLKSSARNGYHKYHKELERKKADKFDYLKIYNFSRTKYSIIKPKRKITNGTKY